MTVVPLCVKITANFVRVGGYFFVALCELMLNPSLTAAIVRVINPMIIMTIS